MTLPMKLIATPNNPAPDGAEIHTIKGFKGTSLRVCLTPAKGPPRGTVILFEGYTEFLEKYFETISDLQARGFNTIIMDWRSQGLSARKLKNPYIFYFQNFDEPVRDLIIALDQFKERLPRPWVTLAHSMGGAIALRAVLIERIRPEAALFCAPMWGIAAATLPNRIAARVMRFIGLGQLPVSIRPKDPREEVFSENEVTSDEARFNRNWDAWRACPDIRIAGPSFAWFAAACDVTQWFRKTSRTKRLRFPITILTASEETIVRNDAHDALAARLPDVKHKVIQGAKHELLQERDIYRDQALGAFDDLLKRAGI